ncbi:hypothetical protein HZS_4754 [Henneguya salminicola]|nr:hypothetical protein HZS_4754 [Henneguya salminicola]
MLTQFVIVIKKPDDLLIVASVFIPPYSPVYLFNESFILTENYSYKIMEEQNSLKKSLHESCVKISEQHNISVEYRILDPSNHTVGDTLILFCNKIKADTIILGSRNVGKLEEFILGTTSMYIATHSKIPATICPPVSKDN